MTTDREEMASPSSSAAPGSVAATPEARPETEEQRRDRERHEYFRTAGRLRAIRWCLYLGLFVSVFVTPALTSRGSVAFGVPLLLTSAAICVLVVEHRHLSLVGMFRAARPAVLFGAIALAVVGRTAVVSFGPELIRVGGIAVVVIVLVALQAMRMAARERMDRGD